MGNKVETLINLFTIRDGKINILLVHKKDEPYKGYWLLPTSFVSNKESLKENTKNLLNDYFDNQHIELKQNEVFGELDRMFEDRVIGISYVGFIDAVTVDLKHIDGESDWFDITNLPKLGYDHNFVIGQAMDYLRSRFKEISTLKELYPSDFTLPELQRVFETIFNKEIDRRNFRKKLLHFDIIKETGDRIKGSTGRPAKLYCFKDDIEKEELF